MWEISLESGGRRHPHLSTKAENQAANLETVDPAQSPGDGDLLKAPTAEETSVDSCGPEHPQRTSRQWESNGGQPRDKCGREGEDKCSIMWPRAPTVRNKWETSGVQAQNHAAQSIHRQVRYKCRIMRPRASTAYLEAVGGQVGDKGSKFRFKP